MDSTRTPHRALLDRSRQALSRYLDWEAARLRAERAAALGLADLDGTPTDPVDLAELTSELATVVAELIGHHATLPDRPAVSMERRLGEVRPPVPGVVRVTLPDGVADDELRQAAGLVGYAWRVTVAGAPLGEPRRVSWDIFEVAAALNTSTRSAPGAAAADFDARVIDMLVNGSPIRRSDREGPGTRGTRLLEGLGERWRSARVRYIETPAPPDGAATTTS